jgi:hypothetical protein
MQAESLRVNGAMYQRFRAEKGRTGRKRRKKIVTISCRKFSPPLTDKGVEKMFEHFIPGGWNRLIGILFHLHRVPIMRHNSEIASCHTQN